MAIGPPFYPNVRCKSDQLRARLRHLLGAIGNDVDLDLGAAVGVLAGTASDLLARLDVFTIYPIAVCRLSRRWFPATYLNSRVLFLHIMDADLDVGVGLQLQDIALSQGEFGVARQALPI